MKVSKKCKTCGVVKKLFYFYKGSKYYQSSCKVCEIKRSNLWGKNNRDKTSSYLKKWRESNKNTPKLKSRVITENMVKRSKHKGFSYPEFTSDDVLKIIDGGRCAVTGIPFEFSQEHFTKSPWTPTPDRIDSSKGYTKENTQFVCYIYNTMKSEFTNEVIIKFINSIYKNRNKIA